MNIKTIFEEKKYKKKKICDFINKKKKNMKEEDLVLARAMVAEHNESPRDSPAPLRKIPPGQLADKLKTFR